MVSVATFVRRVPLDVLRPFLMQCGVTLPDIDSSEKSKAIQKNIVDCIQAADAKTSARVFSCVSRICGMSNESGENALISVISDRSVIESLPGGHARACWMFVNDPQSFKRAEEARHTDQYRRGRRWTGVQAEPGLMIRSDKPALARFSTELCRDLRSNHIYVDIFDRERIGFDNQSFSLVQATIYRDGMPEDYPEFVDGEFGWRSRNRVLEAAITYEPLNGAVEVVGDKQDDRESLLRLFAIELLGLEPSNNRLPLRRFDLDELLRPHKFPTDAGDGIESVSLAMLRLQPFDKPGERIIFECNSAVPAALWKMADHHLGLKNSLRLGFIVTQAKLVIRFHPDASSRRGKTLPLTITAPHGCDLKDRTEKERMIGEKYLRRWKLLADA